MWSDKETEQDCLGFTSNVEVLAQCCTHERLSPLTLGIFGFWGSGKTSLMKMLRAKIEQTNDSERTITLWFNAWRYEGRDEAQSALIHAIVQALSNKRSLSEKAETLAKQVVKGANVMKLAKVITKSTITMTPDLDGFLSAFSDGSKKLAETMEEFEGNFEKLLAQVNVETVVVFIDDLDRCSSEKVVETFETIKLFLNTPRCTFVIGADPSRIEEAVGEVYSAGPQTRRDYLEKIIHLPFQIPEQGLRDIECYLGFLVLQPHLEPDLWLELLAQRAAIYATPKPILEVLKAWVSGRSERLGNGFEPGVQGLERILSQATTIARGLRGNPRQIKRFLNILALREQLAAANRLVIDHAILVKLAVLEYAWREFFESLVDSMDPATGRSEFVNELLRKSVEELEASEDSALLVSAAKQPGLLTFLKDEPLLVANIDLAPYLFLAQTSFGAARVGLATVDQVVTGLVARIANADRVVSRAAARRAAQAESTVTTAIVRALTTELLAKDDQRIRTNIIIGMDEIGQRASQHYAAAVEAVRRLSGTIPEPVGLAAATLFENAERHTEVGEELKARFATGAIARALTGGHSGGSSNRRGGAR